MWLSVVGSNWLLVGEIIGFESVKELVQHGNNREKLIASDKLFNTVTLKSICHGCQV